ncbi:MAG: hypothetical protein JW973_00415 [Bacteroidales bacterium]|nr:hypothetical protein [Bacteroidales bacterium]
MKIFKHFKFISGGIIFLIAAYSCENVEDGYRVDYKESSAIFNVSLQTYDRGAIGDTIRFHIEASSNYDIKSLIVNSTVSGSERSGFEIDPYSIDPLIDHAFGTIQEGTREFSIYYNYIITQDTVDLFIMLTLIDEEGMKSDTQKVYTVPSIVKYNEVTMYTQTADKADGFSTLDATVFHYLPNYSEISEANVKVQESVDIIFVVSNDVATILAPYNGTFESNFAVKNKTRFQLLQAVSSEEFNNLNNATVSQITENYNVDGGSTSLTNIKVGDIIGFKTDFASSNPYHYGILRISAIHPANSDYYEGVCYVFEMDVVTQIKG